MKSISSSTARRRTANARVRSFGGPQMPSPVRRIAPKPRRCTEISPPSETSPAKLAESSFLLMVDLQILPLTLSHESGNTTPIPNTHGNNLLLLSSIAPATSHADREWNDIRQKGLRHTADLPDRRSHEFRPDGIANIFAQYGVDRGEVIFAQRPTAYFLDGGELFWTTRAPECDANSRLVEEPADRQMNHALSEAFASEGIQPICCSKVLGEMRLLKLGIAGLAHVVFCKLAICVHGAA